MKRLRTIAGALTSPAALVAWFWEFVRAQIGEAAAHKPLDEAWRAANPEKSAQSPPPK